MRVVSYVILGIMVLIFFTSMNFYSTSNELLNYQLRTFYHANIAHLLANGFSFYNLSFIEDIIGSGQFLLAIVFISVVSSLLLYFYHKFVPSRKVLTVGFSGVIFGLFVVYFSLMGQNSILSVGGLLLSIIPQLLVPGISFEGHVCGIIAGCIYVLFFRPKRFMTK